MKHKKLWLIAGLCGLLLVLTGCVDTNSAGQPTGDGWVYKLLVHPMGMAIHFFAENLHWGYGFAIITITVIVRLCILPLGLHSSKKMMLQQEKMQAIQPEMMRIQQKMKLAATEAERQRLNLELGALMKENNISMFGGMGCLPLIIQMPFFTALFYASRYTPGIADSTFFGVDLGSPSFMFVIFAFASYMLQSYLSMLSVPKEQRAQMKVTMMISPIMIAFMSLSAPAGCTLYWCVGGLFSCLQTLIVNYYHKPRIRRQVQEQLKKNPVKTKVDVDEILPDDIVEHHREREAQKTAQHDYHRNEGKQHHHDEQPRFSNHPPAQIETEETHDETQHEEQKEVPRHQRNAGKQHPRHHDS